MTLATAAPTSSAAFEHILLEDISWELYVRFLQEISLEREPIYAALGVPELWRFDGQRFGVFHLGQNQTYAEASASLAFPFLPIPEFAAFVKRRHERDELKVLTEFRDWVKGLA